MMIQPWLNVAGVALDFAGFALLLREWWLAFFSEGRQIEFEERFERLRKMREFAQANAPDAQRRHLETSNKLMEDQAIRAERGAQVAARGARRGVFVVAASLIIVGFALQIAAAWPF